MWETKRVLPLAFFFYFYLLCVKEVKGRRPLKETRSEGMKGGIGRHLFVRGEANTFFVSGADRHFGFIFYPPLSKEKAAVRDGAK